MIPTAACLMASVGGAPQETFRSYLLSLGAKSYFDARETPLESIETGPNPCENGDPVEYWYSVSDAGEPTLDTAGTNTPTYIADDGDGYPCLRFAGSDSMLGQGSDDPEDGGDLNWTLVIVFRASSATTMRIAGWRGNGNPSQTCLLITAAIAFMSVSNTSGPGGNAGDAVVLGTTRHVAILEMIYGDPYITIDGRARVGPGIAPGGSYNMTQMSVGSDLGYDCNADIYEVSRIPGASLTAGERLHLYELAQLTGAPGWGVT